MEEYDSNSGNENKRMKTTNIPEIVQNMDTWMDEIEKNNLDNLDNYISNTFALLRDKRLYGTASKYGISSDEMNELIPKIETINNIIINNNYETQIKDRSNIAKLGGIIKGLSNGTFRGGLRRRKKTHKKSRHGSRSSRRGRNSKKRKTRYSKKRM
jgi:hypothetical protein